MTFTEVPGTEKKKVKKKNRFVHEIPEHLHYFGVFLNALFEQRILQKSVRDRHERDVVYI